MYLKLMEDNANQIVLSNKINESSLKGVAEEVMSFFHIDEEQLTRVFSMFGILDMQHLLIFIGQFFTKKINLSRVTIADLEKLNLNKLAYSFIKESGLSIPQNMSLEEKEMVKAISFKLGRILIHNVLFPELVKINPNLAFSVLNSLKRTVSSIAAAEGASKREITSLLCLDDIEIPLSPLAITQQAIAKATRTDRPTYITTVLTITELDKMAKILLKDFDAIRKKSAFTSLLKSDGNDIQPLTINSNKIELITHLFYRMNTPYDPEHSRLIQMNKGKAFWQFFQQNIIDESGNMLSVQLKKLSSNINKSNPEQVTKDVKSILEPIYKQRN